MVKPKINNVGIKVGFIFWWIPIAKMIIHKDHLEFNGNVLGNFVFLSGDVQSIALKGRRKGLLKTYKINHTVPNYPSNIYFICFGKCSLIERVYEFVFKKEIITDNTFLEKIKKYQESGPSPFKKHLLIPLGIIFGFFLAYDWNRFITIEEISFPLGIGTFIVLAITVTFSAISLVFPTFGQSLLKDNRTIKDIDRFYFLLIFFCASILLPNLLMGSFF